MVTAFYARSEENVGVPVALVLARVSQKVGRSDLYPMSRPRPENEYDGDTWWGGTDRQRESMALGFLACQQAEMRLEPTMTADQLKLKLDAWFGYVDHQSVAQSERGNDKLGPTILRIEGLKSQQGSGDPSRSADKFRPNSHASR